MSQPPPPANPYVAAPQPMDPQDEKTWAILTHVGGILFSWVAPLVAYLVFRDRGPFIRQHTTSSLNFHLTMLIGYVVGFITSLFFIGYLLFLAIWIVVVVFGILAAMAASRGEFYTYPLSIKFVQ